MLKWLKSLGLVALLGCSYVPASACFPSSRWAERCDGFPSSTLKHSYFCDRVLLVDTVLHHMIDTSIAPPEPFTFVESDTFVSDIVNQVVAALGPESSEFHRPLSQEDAAEWLGVSTKTLYCWTYRDDDPAPAFFPGGTNGKPKYLRAELLDWLRRQLRATDLDRTAQ
jgi:hypothetical protein